MRTIAEVVAQAAPNEVLHLAGETVQGSNVDVWPDGVIVVGGNLVGQTQVFDAHGGGFVECSFTDTSGQKLQGLLRMLGGTGWTVSGCRFVGGVVASQLDVGLNSRVARGCPTFWRVNGCTFEPLSGQWGTYPQGHNVYVLTDPDVDMGAMIDDCTLSGSAYGAAIKMGGTGFQPRSEGTRGVVVADCRINGVVDAAGRCLAVLTNGTKTDVTVRDCVIENINGIAPWCQAMDGARLRMERTRLPLGVVENATWYVLWVWKTEKKVTVKPGIKPPTVGGITWA